MTQFTELKNTREAMNWTQGQLAKELGVTQATISRWESGGAPCSGPAQKLISRLVKEVERHGAKVNKQGAGK